MKSLLALVAAGLVATAAPAPAASPPSVHLPTEADAVAVALGAETIFFGGGGVETVLPGPVVDEERVLVGLGPDGSVRRVEVVQRLTLRGLGDYRFKVPGPARDVEGLGDSGVEPGLRRGSVLWQGFSEGTETLRARMSLFPDQEAGRLPVAFDLRVTVDGHPLLPGRAASGALEVDLEVRNTSAIPIGIQRAAGEPERLAPVLDAVRSALRAGRRPVPGEGGLPERVRVRRDPESEVEDVETPFRVRGTLSFAPGTVRSLTAEGGETDGRSVAFDVSLGGGRPVAHRVHVSGKAAAARFPELALAGEPALPDAGMVAPPGGSSWRAAVRSADPPDGGEMVDALLEALWRVARLRQFDGYLGNPDPTGPSETTYRFELVAPEAVAAVPAPTPAPAPWAAALTWIGLALLLATAVVVWSFA